MLSYVRLTRESGEGALHPTLARTSSRASCCVWCMRGIAALKSPVILHNKKVEAVLLWLLCKKQKARTIAIKKRWM